MVPALLGYSKIIRPPKKILVERADAFVASGGLPIMFVVERVIRASKDDSASLLGRWAEKRATTIGVLTVFGSGSNTPGREGHGETLEGHPPHCLPPWRQRVKVEYI
jgi:hypothetical protein